MNLIGFAVARSEATNKGLADAEANRIGILGALMPNPVTALVVGRSLADKEVPAPAPVVVTPPGGEPPKPDGRGVEERLDATEIKLREVAKTAHAATLEAKASGKAAAAAAKDAEEVKKAVRELGRDVRTGLERISRRLEVLEGGTGAAVVKAKGG